ncbi:hypothetical protein J0H58_26055 [bacterium]|nr:hypothetical protein [bacterium]
MFPADRLPIPVFVAYDYRGGRARKLFDDGLGQEARAFYAAKMKAGKNPKVLKADLTEYGRVLPADPAGPSEDGAAPAPGG